MCRKNAAAAEAAERKDLVKTWSIIQTLILPLAKLSQALPTAKSSDNNNPKPPSFVAHPMAQRLTSSM